MPPRRKKEADDLDEFGKRLAVLQKNISDLRSSRKESVEASLQVIMGVLAQMAEAVAFLLVERRDSVYEDIAVADQGLISGMKEIKRKVESVVSGSRVTLEVPALADGVNGPDAERGGEVVLMRRATG